MKKDIRKTVCLALTGLMLFAFTACTTSETTEPVMSHPEAYTEATVQYEAPKPGLDYFVLVNKTNKLPMTGRTYSRPSLLPTPSAIPSKSKRRLTKHICS